MAYSAVSTKATGDTVAASDWNTYLRDNMSDHEARLLAQALSGCRLTRATDQSTTDNVNTDVTWTAETYDQGGWFTPSGTTITVPAGALPSGYTTIIVVVAVQIYWASNATGSRNVQVYKNGSEFASQKASPGVTGTFAQVFTAPAIHAVPTDTFKAVATQSSGGTLALAGATQEMAFSVTRIGYF